MRQDINIIARLNTIKSQTKKDIAKINEPSLIFQVYYQD